MPKREPEYVGSRTPASSGGGGGWKSRFSRPFLAMAIVLVAVCLVFMWLLSSFATYVRPNEWGIKEVRIGTDRGIEKEVYGPGSSSICLSTMCTGCRKMCRCWS